MMDNAVTAGYDASSPLLTVLRRESNRPSVLYSWSEAQAELSSSMRDMRTRGRQFLTSRSQLYLLMTLVALDAAILLFNVFLQLMAYEMHQFKEPWVQRTSRGLEAIGLIFSIFFLLESAVAIVLLTRPYVSTWFHIFDAAVVLVSFAINVAAHGAVRSIGSLIIVVRLWRLCELSEEAILEASDRIDILAQRNQELSEEARCLRQELGLTHTTDVLT